MSRKRSLNPGKPVCLYLRGPHLSFLRTLHPRPGEAIRQLINQAAQAQPAAEAQALPHQPVAVTPALCPRCCRLGMPICPSCKAAFYG
jgi:hypothetical protein